MRGPRCGSAGSLTSDGIHWVRCKTHGAYHARDNLSYGYGAPNSRGVEFRGVTANDVVRLTAMPPTASATHLAHNGDSIFVPALIPLHIQR
jgi:hypothetical protein